RIGRRAAGVLPRQPAVGTGDRPRRGSVVRGLVGGCRRGAATGTAAREARMRIRWAIALAAALLLAGPSRAADRIPVVATFSVIPDMLAQVGGDHVEVKTIVRAGDDCELYQPTAADVATVAAARAVFVNDLNEEFEPWLEPLLKQAQFAGTKIVVTR